VEGQVELHEGVVQVRLIPAVTRVHLTCAGKRL
jgi:hypothetical protein